MKRCFTAKYDDKILNRWFLALFFALFLAVSPPSAAAQDAPVVHAVLFWSKGCGHCHLVLEKVLPPLQAKYGKQLQLLLLEASEPFASELYQAAVTTFQISEGRRGVPTLVIGDLVLVGSSEIPEKLPGEIERGLAAGGLAYPRIPGLEKALNAQAPHPNATVLPSLEGTPEAGAQSKKVDLQAEAGKAKSLTLAILILGGIVLALVNVLLLWAKKRAAWVFPAAWEGWAVPLLGLLGLGVAGYLAYVEWSSTTAICGPIGDCNAVQNSEFAKLFGVLPLGWVGVFGYLAILGTWQLGRSKSLPFAALARQLAFGLALFGTLFSLYLTSVEIFVLQAVCLWCLSSASLMTLLLLWLLPPVLEPAG